MASKTLTIEVGNEFIKLCEMQHNKNQVIVHHAISVQTPTDTVEDGFVKDIMQVSEVIRNAMTEKQIAAKEVTFVLNSSRVATKEVILPLVKRDKIQDLVNANASEYFPVNIDDYVLSYTVLEEKKTKEEQKSRILVYAAPEAMVQSYFDLAQNLGVKVKAVDYAGNSTLQLIKIQIDTRPTLVVQLGMDTTIVSVMNNNILQLQRTIPYGESLLLNQVMETRNVKSNVALELLSSAQIVKESLDKDATTASLKHLISNVNRVIEYYSSRNQEAPLQKIVIIGEGADVLGIDVLFANETSLPAERLTILKNVESYNRFEVSTSLLKQYMANVGASLNPIHLQPKAAVAVAGKKNKQVNIIYYAAGMVLMLMGAAALALIPIMQYQNKKSDKEKLEDRISELSSVEKVYADYAASNDAVDDIYTYYLTTLSNIDYAPEFFEYLETIMPSDARLKSVDMTQDGVVKIIGLTMQEYEIADFMNDLEKDIHVTNVTSSGYRKEYEKNGLVEFNVQFNMISEELLSDLGLSEKAAAEAEAETNAEKEAE